MDGNRRWAKSRFFPAIAWHKAWADNVVTITELCDSKGISHLTLWALSTENLQKRPQEEIDGIIKLINSIEKYLEKMHVENLRFNVIWDVSRLPSDSQDILNTVVSRTSSNTWITLTIALIYWWQDEIVRATKRIINAWINPSDINEWEFRKYLDTWNLPIIDMIVRTGWDIRHSWFLLYDSAYSEYYFSEKNWPDFDEKELNIVLDQFNGSKRNFWK